MPASKIDLLQGTLDPWAISERIRQISKKRHPGAARIALSIPASPRTSRLDQARWATTESNRPAKYYELTNSGRKQLETEVSDCKKLAAAVAQVLETT